ncbi:hypothetical protein PIB30_062172 [Stylosanthes scabra]|uniref:Uncharacterized protein n=1 Tax=Stylosanthes scabra TaxID=79078 RepID=A0ABU6ZJT6_9FABA|nr:hypothetical protein [Stylosanthes scabra]
MFLNDADALEMVRIGVERGYVELFAVHDDVPKYGFPEIGYVDVPGDPPGENVGPGREVEQNDEGGAEADVANGQNEEGVVEADVPNDENGGGDVEEAAPVVEIGEEAVEEGDEEGVEEAISEEAGAGAGSVVEAESNEEASHNDHAKEVVGEEEVDSVEDIHFTDSEEDLDLGDNFFGVQIEAGDTGVDKGKTVLNEDFEEKGEDSDELEGGYEANLAEYRWEVGTVYASREEFKEAMTANAVYTKRGIKFYKVDRTRAKWLGKEFKKKVQHNPKVKAKELVAKVDRKWNLTVSSSMAAKTRQNALNEIQGTYKRLADYAAELIRLNPGSSIHLKVSRSPDFEQEVQNSSMTGQFDWKIDELNPRPVRSAIRIVFAIEPVRTGQTRQNWSNPVKTDLTGLLGPQLGNHTALLSPQVHHRLALDKLEYFKKLGEKGLEPTSQDLQ